MEGLKMKRIIHYLSFVILLLSVTELYAQKSSTAVMEIRVEVISGSTIALNNTNDLDSGWETFKEGSDYDIRVGGFSVTLPEGVEIISELNDKLNLTNGTNSVSISTKIHQVKNNDGTISFAVTGKNETNLKSSTGHYSGKKTATIQYL